MGSGRSEGTALAGAAGDVRCLDVIVPGPWWNTLTYALPPGSFPSEVTPGARVRVPVGKGERTGFAAAPPGFPPVIPKGLKAVKEVLDEKPVLGDELWGLARWIGNTFLCGAGTALQLICPPPLLRGEAFTPTPAASCGTDARKFRKVFCYNPLDEERRAFYFERVAQVRACGGRALLLFPESEIAAVFFARLPKALKTDALFWPRVGGKKLWEAWKRTRDGDAPLIVGGRAAVFAPASFDEIIVDDEANPAYIFHRAPRISARSIAGKRALTLEARLVFGGRMPSARTFLRSRPESSVLPERRDFVFVDMARSFKKEVRGTDGGLPLTTALLQRTRAALAGGRHAFWIMDRRGQSGEVYCADCGGTLFCLKCGSVLRSEDGGTALHCGRCGARGSLPEKCPVCAGVFLRGKRPGLEALLSPAMSYVKDHPVLPEVPKMRLPAEPSLILGTRRTLSLCDNVDVGLIAWLDLDVEMRKADYNARFQTFSMVWESFWRGRSKENSRTVLIQSRRSGEAWRRLFCPGREPGWKAFWEEELKERKNLDLPPWKHLVQIDLPQNENREAFMRGLEDAGLFIMDTGDVASPLWVTVKSSDRLRDLLASRFEIKHSRIGFPVVTVWTE